MSEALHKFEGRDVIGARIKITGAGDGLSQALAIEPAELRSGTKVYVVTECTVGAITFEPVKDTDAFTRVQTLKAGTATMIDKALVAEMLEAQRAKIEAAKGIQRIDFEGDEDGHDGE